MTEYRFKKELKLVVLDVDGTLYVQSVLRKIMRRKLLSYYLLRPWKIRELLVLYYFRKERENKAGYQGTDLEQEQYAWAAARTGRSVQSVKEIISYWIFTVPNPYLRQCMYSGLPAFFEALRRKRIRIAIYSDYDSREKLKQMGLEADFQLSSTDPRVNCFKPSPKGLLVTLAEFNIRDKENCLFIGDRIELDGECAAAAGVPFLLVEKGSEGTNFYNKLTSQLLLQD